jgi:glutathione S-transferase
MAEMTLWGFNNSTYVRTVKMVLAEKQFTGFKQVPINVLAGEPKTPEHLERHPFGKVPVLDHDGLRILETSAIARYLNDVLPGKSLVPPTPKDRARMDMIVGIVDSYGYGAKSGRRVAEFVMKTRGDSPFIAGELSLADLYLAPIVAYVEMTPDKNTVFDVPGFSDWWANVQALESFKATQLG